MRFVDLRSDTVTLPTPEMRKAMYEAEVGDDVYREDPTITKLEELGAEITGKEAGLFVTSGTMGNQVAVMVHTQKSDEIICEAESHIYFYEVGGMACLSGAQPRPVAAKHGILTPELIRGVIRDQRDIHVPKTGLICIENTHNRAGGTCYSIEQLAGIKALAEQHNIPVHMDGARIFNAAVALNTTPKQLTQYADTVQFCISKGLAAPVGSLIVGSREFIEYARRFRKMVGGGLRQAGFMAAAGIVALTSMIDRLAEDHDNANKLGQAAANLGLDIDLSTVQTNIVIFNVASLGVNAEQFSAKLLEQGIKANPFGEYNIRMVTHYGITTEDIDYTASVLARLFKA